MRLERLLREMAAAEAGLAADLRRLADDYRADQDVHAVAIDLALWSQDHAAALAERAQHRLPETAPAEPVADGDPDATLLRDLRDVHTAACGVASDWDVLGQVAKGRRDDDLQALVQLCSAQTARQVTWLRATRNEAAAQAVRG
jgi:hypothetical protein